MKRAWAALLVGLLVVAGLLQHRRDAGPPGIGVATDAPPEAAAVRSATEALRSHARAPASTPGVVSPAAELCHRLRPNQALAPDDPLRKALQTEADATRERAIRALEQAGNDRERLAGALLRGDFTQAARLARASQDGETYGMALRACDAAQRGAVFRAAASATTAAEMPRVVAQESGGWSALCETLTLERWAQLEPANAAPWLYRLQQAQQRGERAAALDALHHAGQAATLNTGELWLSDRLALALPDDAPATARLQLWLDTAGSEAAKARLSEAAVLGSFCRGGEIEDANSRQACGAVAVLLARHAPDIANRVAGLALAERLGLDTRALDGAALRAAAQWKLEDFLASKDGADACASTRAFNDYALDRARRGELAAVQARMPAGKP